MPGQNPHETLNQLIDAINAGDVQRALTCYHPDGVFIPEPGKWVTEIDAIHDAWTGLVASKTRVVIESHEAIEAGDVALYCTRWSLSGTGPDGTAIAISGRGAVVLRRAPDGKWLIAIENPWARHPAGRTPCLSRASGRHR
jgi:uncharacterized protein (TIGR02246 family)